MPQTIIILDPDAEFARMLAEQLQDAGLTVAVAADAETTLARIAAGEVAALVIASSLGAVPCRQLRLAARHLAVILLAGPADPAELLGPIEADEVFVRPIRIGALIGRLRSLAETGTQVAIAIGPYHFDSAAKRLSLPARGEVVHLTEKETEILRALARAGTTAVPREQLLSEVWRYNPEVTTHTLETHIYRLRQKMETDAAPGPFLLTEAGGYRLAVG